MKRKRRDPGDYLIQFWGQLAHVSIYLQNMVSLIIFCERQLVISMVCCSFAMSSPTLCSPLDCSTPGFPVLHYLPEFAHTHMLWVSDAIQSSHPLSPPSPAFNLSEHQGLFQWVSSSHEVPKYWSFSFNIQCCNTQDWSPSEWTGWISLQSKGLSRVFSNTTVQKHEYFTAQLSL